MTKVKKVSLIQPLYMTFFLAFLALTGSTFVTILGTLFNFRGHENYVKSALISETAVNIIAGLTYYYFLKYLYDDSISLENITSVRYIDWIITTPLLLLSFALYADYQKQDSKGTGVEYTPLSYIIILNTLMLLFGFYGETKRMNKFKAFCLSFFCFGLLFFFLHEAYVKGNAKNIETVFYVLLVVWALYGFAYYLEVRNKNIAYNILDLISKSGFGIFLWLSSIEITKDNNIGQAPANNNLTFTQ
jgi:sensory rhodopsin